jgi:hypothetical protein
MEETDVPFHVPIDFQQRIETEGRWVRARSQRLEAAVEALRKQRGSQRRVAENENLLTWGQRSRFSYAGSVRTGTTISCRSGYLIFVTPEVYSSLLDHFQGMAVDAGASTIDPPAHSVGEWLRANLTKTAVACYVCPILIDEGFAERVSKSQIAFVKR